MTPRTQRRRFRGLAEICGRYDVLPGSYVIPESKVQRRGDPPILTGTFSYVSRGMYIEHEGERDQDKAKLVAIKVMRHGELDYAHTAENVRCFDLLPSHIRP